MQCLRPLPLVVSRLRCWGMKYFADVPGTIFFVTGPRLQAYRMFYTVDMYVYTCVQRHTDMQGCCTWEIWITITANAGKNDLVETYYSIQTFRSFPFWVLGGIKTTSRVHIRYVSNLLWHTFCWLLWYFTAKKTSSDQRDDIQVLNIAL